MPWNETCTMNERNKLIDAWLSREFNITQLSERFKVSRKTIYKWLGRYDLYGREGLVDVSRAPINTPHKTPTEIRDQIVRLKHRFPYWGPMKLNDYLRLNYPDVNWPATSTMGEILKVSGLVKRKKRRHKVPPHSQPLRHADEPNKVWSADFKGQFKLGNDKVCYPLTLTDNYSRYLLACDALPGLKLSGVRPVYERLFREFGLPDAIRTDNGYPFAQVCLGGLSPLSIWLLRLGILPERIDKGCPQQNGRHERMHRTLKQETVNPAAITMRAQQRAFDQFVADYNNERPHQSLSGMTPASVYHASLRPFPEVLPDVEYPSEWQVRKVKCAGQIKLFSNPIYVSRQLIGEYVGLKPVGNAVWQIYYCRLPMGIIDERIGRVTRPS